MSTQRPHAVGLISLRHHGKFNVTTAVAQLSSSTGLSRGAHLHALSCQGPFPFLAVIERVVWGPPYISLNIFLSRIQTSPALPDWVIDIYSIILTPSKVYKAYCIIIYLYYFI